MKKMTTDPKMLELLVCPITKGMLSLDRNTQELISLKAKIAYPIRNGVPIMLASEARPLQNNKTQHTKK
ncbi:Trm112 family protein [Bartonella sp. CB175]|uniref:Trm112 family protein n=1 Tax=Bartonella sp. CB175 TaxID=3112256 RepID=UPI00300DDCC3